MIEQLVIGAGQIGSALKEILSRKFDVGMRDLANMSFGRVPVLHICFPDCPDFVADVKEYQRLYSPDLTIIHSSVHIGTTERVGEHTVHSPIRGRHPNLVSEMPKYKKFVGGFDMNDVDKACMIFEAVHWETQGLDNPNVTEALKLVSNVHMGLEIAWRQELERIGIDGEAYRLWEESYRTGYQRAGDHDLIRPIMRPDPIGGHCILECTELLKNEMSSIGRGLCDLIVESNQLLKEAICQRA